MKAFLITVFAILFALVIAIISALPAHAQPRCGPEEGSRNMLETRYGESVIETTVETREGLEVTWEFWLNPATGTWSVTGSAKGAICLFANGGNYSGQSLGDFLVGEAT